MTAELRKERDEKIASLTKQGKSQYEIAGILEISQSTVNKILRKGMKTKKHTNRVMHDVQSKAVESPVPFKHNLHKGQRVVLSSGKVSGEYEVYEIYTHHVLFQRICNNGIVEKVDFANADLRHAIKKCG